MTNVVGPTPMLLLPGIGQQLPLIGTLRASAAETGGAIEVIEYSGPAAPPPHVHREHDEVFIILTGTFRFILGRETMDAPQGTVVLVPRGSRHGFTIDPGSTALLLVLPSGLEINSENWAPSSRGEGRARKSVHRWPANTIPIRPLQPKNRSSSRGNPCSERNEPMQRVLAKWGRAVVAGPLCGGNRNTVAEIRLNGQRMVARESVRSPASLDWEVALLDHLASHDLRVPVPVPALDGRRHVGGVMVQTWLTATRQARATGRRSLLRCARSTG